MNIAINDLLSMKYCRESFCLARGIVRYQSLTQEEKKHILSNRYTGFDYFVIRDFFVVDIEKQGYNTSLIIQISSGISMPMKENINQLREWIYDSPQNDQKIDLMLTEINKELLIILSSIRNVQN